MDNTSVVKRRLYLVRCDYLHANLLDNIGLLINGYSKVYLDIFNVLTGWIFFEMDYQVDWKMTMLVTASENLPMVVSKTKRN